MTSNTQPYGGPNAPIVVLKFGSSVLETPSDIVEAVSEIYRFIRSGRRVVAVTSALAGETDRLLAEAERWGVAHDNVAAPSYVAIGEETTAAFLAMACDRAGMCSKSLRSAELGILAEGLPDAATPIGIDASTLQAALTHYDVVVVPGYTARDAQNRIVLLGRGGSDLTAIFLGHRLDAERIRLLKDVDGVYDADPAAVAGAPRYTRITWDHATAVAGKLIQPRALAYAKANDVEVEVGELGSEQVTCVGRDETPPMPRILRRKLRVALGGCGVVGAGVAERLLRNSDAFEIVGVLVRDTTKARATVLSPLLYVTTPVALLARNPDVIVDVLSSGAAGAALCEEALANGVAVVSANKQAIATAHDPLRRLSGQTKAHVLYSAAVGGGAPLLETIAAANQAGGITEIRGVLNGTVNFVLGLLQNGVNFEDALASARAAGLAEEDTTADLSGADTTAKLQLIALQAFGEQIEDIQVEALDGNVVEHAASQQLRQVGRIQRSGGKLIGAIRYEPADFAGFAILEGDRNALTVTLADGQEFTARGRGAGRWPTTESVYADLIDLRNLITR